MEHHAALSAGADLSAAAAEWSLSFFCLLHLWFAGFGMYSLARRWTGNNFAAAFAGTAFAFNGFTLNLLMWPSHIATLAGCRGSCWRLNVAWREGGRKIFLAAFVGAMQMLAGGPETIFLTWLLLLALWIQQLVTGGGGAAALPTDAPQRVPTDSPRGAVFRRFPCVVPLVIALTRRAIAAVPRSRRAFATRNRLRRLALVHAGVGLGEFSRADGFRRRTREWACFSNTDRYWTSSYYLGIGTLWLALLAIWTAFANRPRLAARRRASSPALIFALGENTPVYPALRRIIPQLSLITYPVKFVTLAVFAAPLLAAFALAQ